MKYIEHPPNRPICFSPAVAAKPEQPQFRELVFYGIGWAGAALALQPVARGGPLQFRVGFPSRIPVRLGQRRFVRGVLFHP